MREATKELTELERRMANQEEQRKKLGDEVKEQVRTMFTMFTPRHARHRATPRNTANPPHRHRSGSSPRNSC